MKLAFAGTGYINKIHALAAKTAGAELAAVVNHQPDSMVKFAAEFDIPRQYGTLEALLKDGGVDALVVSTPNYLHAEQTLAALEAGIHVLVEKPMAMSAAEAQAMQKAAEKTGKTLMVAHCWRFDPEAIWLRAQVTAGRIGKIIRTKGCGVHVNWGPGGWFTKKKFAGGGAMADMGVHALDTARFLLGDPQPVSVYAKIGTYYGDYDVDDTGLVIVNWDNGATSYFESGWWQPHADQPNAGTQLYGQKGFASLFPTRIETLDVDDGGFAPRLEHRSLQGMYDAQMKYFLDCASDGKTPIPSGMEGWINMKVVDAAYESSKTGKLVEIKDFNPLLKKLGYSETDRLVIIHTDDIGMCQASLQAFKDLWEFGTISSGAVMVPCPWFPATAEFCRNNPEVDMGVHATLNAEWESYRWGPVSTCDPESGLLDKDGYFHQWHPAVYENARPEAVAAEVNAQVEKALAAGIDATHIDSHMGTIMHPKFVQSYLQAGASRLIPNMLPRASATGFWMMGEGETAPEIYTPILQQLEAQGLPMIDALAAMPLEHDSDHIGIAKKLLGEVPAGITHFLFHPSIDTPELRAIAPDWRARVANYNAFMSQELKDYIKNSGIQVIGYRALRESLRS